MFEILNENAHLEKMSKNNQKQKNMKKIQKITQILPNPNYHKLKIVERKCHSLIIKI